MLYGDFDFAVGRLQKGVDHDPLNFFYQFHLAQIYLYGVRDYKKQYLFKKTNPGF